MKVPAWLVLFAAALVWACGQGGADAGADTDTGTETEPATDADADGDSDTDPCSNESAPDPFDATHCSEHMPEGDCVYYVNAASEAPDPDGLSWETAVRGIKEGILFARCGLLAHETCQVWVAEGRYHVYQHSRQDTLLLKPGLELFGGFAGGETVFEERDWTVNETILDGQQPDDGPCHVFHVVTGSDDAVLDGFTVTGGQARLTPPDLTENSETGGGMLNISASPTVANCVFTANDASWWGGGMHNYRSAPIVSNCLFTGNAVDESEGWGGAAIFAQFVTEAQEGPVISECIFTGNGNKLDNGGAVRLEDTSATVTDSEFFDNKASWGAAIDSRCLSVDAPECVVTIERCLFEDNFNDLGHATVSFIGDFDCVVRNSEFYDNTGGAVMAFDAAPVVESCVFAGNLGESWGAVANWGGAPRLVNCTISDNAAMDAEGAGGLFADNEGDNADEGAVVSNCVVWGNSPVDMKDIHGATTAAAYSDIGGGWPGMGNIDADPLFVNASGYDFHLLGGSPCIDAANGMAAPELDFEGNGRCDDPDSSNTGLGPPWADMGAFESTSHLNDLRSANRRAP